MTTLLHASHYHLHWRRLLVLLMLVICWFAFSPGHRAIPSTGTDKIDHLLAFAALATCAALAQAAGRRATLLATAGLLLYGGFIEVVQAFLPTRTAEWADLLADGIGVLLGLLLVAALRRLWPAAPR